MYKDVVKERLNEIKKCKRKMGSLVYKSRYILRNAVAAGKISKPSECSYCGIKNNRIEGHHNDHNKPFEVIWLCGDCHRNLHKELFIKSGGMRKDSCKVGRNE